jgi:hypothetical protein
MGWLHRFVGRRALARRVAVMALGLLVIGALTTTLARGPVIRHKAPAASPRDRSSIPTTGGAQQRPSPASAVELADARTAATRFLAGYLRFAYGRASASSVQAVTPGLRRQLAGKRALPTPVERRRHPRVVSLQATGRAPGEVLVTAMVDDGGITTYALRLTLVESHGTWLVSGVDSG